MLDVNHGGQLVGGAEARALPFVAIVGLLVAGHELTAVVTGRCVKRGTRHETSCRAERRSGAAAGNQTRP